MSGPVRTRISKSRNLRNQPPKVSKDPKTLFLELLQKSGQTFDYSNPYKDAKQKFERSEAWSKLANYIQDSKQISEFIIPNLDKVISTICKNILRPVPTQYEPTQEQEGNLCDPAFPHLQCVYEFFFHIIIQNQIEVRFLKPFVTPSFIHQLMSLFNTKDRREKQHLKTIIHRLYAKLVPRRKIIRTAFYNHLLEVIHQTEQDNGVTQILQICCAIISGYATPLRNQHIDTFKQVFIPLYKVRTCSTYQEVLIRCNMLYLSKDPTLSPLLIEGLLKYWPIGSSQKQRLFLYQLNQIIEVTQVDKIQKYIPKLIKKIRNCLVGYQAQSTDRALCFFENDNFLYIVKNYKEICYPLLVPSIHELAHTHSHPILQESFQQVSNIMKSLQPVDYQRAVKQYEGIDIRNNSLIDMHNRPERIEIEDRWSQLLRQAQQVNPELQVPNIPYRENHVVGLNNRNGRELSSRDLAPNQ